jgi:acyl transferase domain-containing protein/NADPH:quinone reductase-like Zn-dependent oxidoreductase/NADP-dependent 3-hydroxy acid dehydrogenase YdfG/acyl carrier protein
MLAQDGRCRPFDAAGEGYVRAEGGVALVLARDGVTPAGVRPAHCRIVGTAINADGHTAGVSLPSAEKQAHLLEQLYGARGVDPDDLAFVEAHGTGTRAGDPIEARALGEALGKRRTRPLPIGSIKSNIGHLEPASGLAGVLKAMLALEHGRLPRSLAFETPNPDIPFADLNLAVAAGPVTLRRGGEGFAGINSFGFGGTNAHAIIAHPVAEKRTRSAGRRNLAASQPAASPGMVVLSAASRPALAALAARHIELLRAAPERTVAELAQAICHGRDLMAERAVLTATTRAELDAQLEALAAGRDLASVPVARAAAGCAAPVFVFSGNGSQWAGMGQAALAANAAFRARFAEIDRIFTRKAGWRLAEALEAPDLAGQLKSTVIAQPLLLALQLATVTGLAEQGIEPAIVLGHSVGEVAAAQAAGALSLVEAVDVIIARSSCQEPMRRLGSMATLRLGESAAAAAIAASGIPGIEVAAVNSPASVTISGPAAAVRDFCTALEAEGIATRQLDLEYPFHSAMADAVREPLLARLHDLELGACSLPFVSTVTGSVLAGPELGAGYWWQNARAPVRFLEGVLEAARLGGGVFIEIGPRPVLQTYLNECLAERGQSFAVTASLSPADDPVCDPIRRTAAAAIAHGADILRERVLGPAPVRPVALPSYPWQKSELRAPRSTEALSEFAGPSRAHPLLGRQAVAGDCCWRAHIGPGLMPWLSDHVVDGHVVYPGTALLETALAAARAWLGTADVVVRDMDILSPMIFRDGETREVKVQISPESGTVELASRPRLGGSDFEVHAVCRASRSPGTGTAAVGTTVGVPAGASWDDALRRHEVYAAAARHGNEYGPAFRRVECVLNAAPGVLLVRLAGSAPDEASEGFALDPRDVDAVFHALFVRPGAMPADGAAPLSLLPVRCGELRVLAEGRRVRFARLDIRREGRQSLLADMTLADEAGVPVATLTGIRIASASLMPRPQLSAMSCHEVSEPVAVAARAFQNALPSCDEVAAAAERYAAETSVECGSEPRLLLEAAALRLAYDRLAMGAPCGAAEVHLMRALAGAGLASYDGGAWRLAPDCPLPEAGDVLRTLIAEHPAWIADAMLLQSAAGGRELPAAMLDQFRAASPRRTPAVALLGRLACDQLANAGTRAPLHVLVIGASCGPGLIVRQLGPRDRLTLCDGDKRTLDRVGFAFSGDHRVAVADLSDASALAAAGPFDLGLSAFGLGEAVTPEMLSRVAGALRPGAMLAAIELEPDVFHAFVFGRAAGGHATGGLAAREDWESSLRQAGFGAVRSLAAGDQAGLLLASGAARPAAHSNGANGNAVAARRPIALVAETGAGAAALSEALAERLGRIGISVAMSALLPANGSRKSNGAASGNGKSANGKALHGDDGKRDASGNGHGSPDATVGLSTDGPSEIVFVAANADGGGDVPSIVEERCAALARLFAAHGHSAERIWIVVPAGSGTGGELLHATRAFVRTAANEHAEADIRLAELDAADGLTAHVPELARAIANPGPDREVSVGRSGLFTRRVRNGPAAPSHVQATAAAAVSAAGERAVLTQGRRRALQSLSWRREPLAPVGPDEVRIEVAATGLNFRDVMWALGLLPEEALEDGFAGPTLGFECSGRVVAAGAGVSHVAPGDPVVAMAPDAFASHVTAQATAVTRLPDNVPLEAAATIPVAYLTAYYALVHLARIREGEWVLIHGGAGGVGLAALEIARERGARIIATAGTEEKRDLLRLLGAEHVLSSRSLAFADEVMQLTGGVDVVLNSLSGEAMEASFSLLKPFGRFLELGKRDFYANTRLGLRPFRRNVSYFGIDADQLLAGQPGLAGELMGELMERFASGTYRPLPHRALAAGEIEDAFRLMQQSGHIGKIVVRPPEVAAAAASPQRAAFRASADGAHVVIGGLGGFGLRTAVWLADHGARTIVLAGRSGRVAEGQQEIVDGLRGRGVDVRIAAADVTVRASLDQLLSGIRFEMPIRGIVHAAAVLDDAIVAKLEPAAIARVLAPKVRGAALIDELTRRDRLDFLLLYSSISALVGNPGQAAYAAANGALEGLARRRRAEGRPALAVRWGAIADAGMLARDHRTAGTLARRAGATGLPARRALDLLSEALLADDGSVDAAVVTIASMNWAQARSALPLLATPLFAGLATEGAGAAASGERVDLAVAIAGLDDAAAAVIVADHLKAELAAILRMPAADFDVRRPLAGMGLDSLMAVELRLAASRRLGLEIPLSALADGLSLGAIAAKAIAGLRRPAAAAKPAPLDTRLAATHVAEALGREEIEILGRHIEARAAPAGEGP